MAALLKIGGVDLTEGLTSYDVSADDVDGGDTGLSETGKKLVHVVRNGVYTISAGWTNVTSAQQAKILDAVSSESVPCEFYFGGKTVKAVMRPTNKKSSLATPVDGGYWHVSCKLEQY